MSLTIPTLTLNDHPTFGLTFIGFVIISIDNYNITLLKVVTGITAHGALAWIKQNVTANP